jgi:hypothetical protein
MKMWCPRGLCSDSMRGKHTDRNRAVRRRSQ